MTLGEQDGLFGPELDGRPIRLPKGTVLAVPSRSLGQALVAEWSRIPDNEAFTPEQLPLTRIAGTMIERIRPDLVEARETLLRHGLDDGLCYRKEKPDSTVERVLEWLAKEGIRPIVTDGLMPITQSGDYITGRERLLAQQNEAELAVLGVRPQSFGSLLLALALVSGTISSEAAIAVANADERRQLEVDKLRKELAADPEDDVPLPVAININVADARVRKDDDGDIADP